MAEIHGKQLLDPNVVYAIPIGDGHLDIRVCSDANYPGLDIEYISDKQSKTDLSRPRVLIERPQPDNVPENLRVLVWADKHSEDYTDKIDLESAATS